MRTKIFLKKGLIVQKMKLSGYNIKKFLISSQKKVFLIFREMETPKKFFIFQKMETLKNFLCFRK